MKRLIQTLCLLILPFLLTEIAAAQHSGPYVGASFGGTMLTTAKCSDPQGNFSLTFDPAAMGGAVLGWDLEPGHPLGEGRIELEYGHRTNPLTKAKFVEGSVAAGGTVAADSLMVNFIGLFRDKSNMTPYAGAGAGAVRIEADTLTITGQPLSSGFQVVFGYQFLAGVDFALTENISLDLGYRLLGTVAPKFVETPSASVAGGVQKISMDYLSHSAVIGLRLGF